MEDTDPKAESTSSEARQDTVSTTGARVAGRRPEVDQVRGLAIASVIILHTMSVTHAWTLWVDGFLFGQCVPIFLLLMGYNAVQSEKRREIGSTSPLARHYDPRHLGRGLRRLVVPFCFLWVFSLVQGLVREEVYHGPLLLLGLLPYTGPGNYFVPLAVQFALLAPLVLWAYSRRPALTALILVACDLGFELAAPHLAVFKTPFVYSICILRYAAIVAVGMWIADGESLFSRRNWFVLPYAAAGLVYIALARATGLELPFVHDWGTQNLASYGWALLLALLLLKMFRSLAAPGRLSSLLARVGRSSYAIFVLQIGWFSLGISSVVEEATGRAGFPGLAVAPTLIAMLAINLLVCLTGGVWWQERVLSRLWPG